MTWRGRRGRRGAKEAAGILAGATLAQAAGTDDAAAAVRRVVASVELERPVGRIGIAAVGDPAVAEAVAAALGPDRDATAGTVDVLAGGGFDAVVAVAPASLAAPAVVDEVRPLGDTLLGVVLVAEAAPEPAPGGSGDAALEALAALERAAGARERPLPPSGGGAPPAGAELERRLADLERREAAFRKVSQVVARRAVELEERIGELQARIDELEGRAPAAPAGAPTMQRLEQLVGEAFARGLPEAEEWSYYLPLLRERADAAGRLPPELDSLVASVFGDALSA